MARHTDSKLVARIKDFLPSKVAFGGRPPDVPFGICLFFLLAAKFYATFRFTLSSRASRNYFYYVNKGWLSEKSYKDYGDMEWIFWKQEATKILGFMLARTALRQLMGGFSRSSDVLLALDLIACTALLGVNAVTFHLALTGIFFVVALARVRLLIWALAAVIIAGFCEVLSP